MTTNTMKHYGSYYDGKEIKHKENKPRIRFFIESYSFYIVDMPEKELCIISNKSIKKTEIRRFRDSRND